jgi:propanediol utilization protein
MGRSTTARGGPRRKLLRTPTEDVQVLGPCRKFLQPQISQAGDHGQLGIIITQFQVQSGGLRGGGLNQDEI